MEVIDTLLKNKADIMKKNYVIINLNLLYYLGKLNLLGHSNSSGFCGFGRHPGRQLEEGRTLEEQKLLDKALLVKRKNAFQKFVSPRIQRNYQICLNT